MKTTFWRQMTVILCLLLAATILLGVGFSALFSRFVEEQQEDALYSTADAAASLLRLVDQPDPDDMNFRVNLSVAADASESDILICDAQGNVIICARDLQGCEHIGLSLDGGLTDRILAGSGLRVDSAAGDLYGERRLAVAMPVVGSGGQVSGVVIASVARGHVRALAGGTTRIFLFTALFAIADSMAIGAMRALRDAGRRIPEDCSVIAIDGLELSAYIEPPLTTLCQPMEEMGRRSIEILLDMIEGRSGNCHEVLPTVLRPGGSVKTLV